MMPLAGPTCSLHDRALEEDIPWDRCTTSHMADHPDLRVCDVVPGLPPRPGEHGAGPSATDNRRRAGCCAGRVGDRRHRHLGHALHGDGRLQRAGPRCATTCRSPSRASSSPSSPSASACSSSASAARAVQGPRRRPDHRRLGRLHALHRHGRDAHRRRTSATTATWSSPRRDRGRRGDRRPVVHGRGARAAPRRGGRGDGRRGLRHALHRHGRMQVQLTSNAPTSRRRRQLVPRADRPVRPRRGHRPGQRRDGGAVGAREQAEAAAVWTRSPPAGTAQRQAGPVFGGGSNSTPAAPGTGQAFSARAANGIADARRQRGR